MESTRHLTKKTKRPLDRKDLTEVKGHHIADLASEAFCSNSYVQKIVRGERVATSTKAIAIRRAAAALNAAILKGKESASKELEIISEGDEA